MCLRLRTGSKLASGAGDANVAEVFALTGILLGVGVGAGGFGTLALKDAAEADVAGRVDLKALTSDIRLPGRLAARLAGRRGAGSDEAGVEKLLGGPMR